MKTGRMLGIALDFKLIYTLFYNMDNLNDIDNTTYSSSEYTSESDDDIYNLQSENIGTLYKNEINERKKLLNNQLEIDYNTIRNKYFTPELIHDTLLIDTKNIHHTDNHDTSNFTVYLKKSNNDNNNKNGYDKYENVIGFRLIRAMIHNTSYTIDDNNNKITLDIDGIAENVIIELTTGAYTVDTLKDEIENKLNTSGDMLNGWTITLDDTKFKYSIICTTQNFKFLWKTSQSESWKLFGAREKDDISYVNASTNYFFPDILQHNNIFVDLVIDEIPYHTCKKNPHGLHVVERIPMNVAKSELTLYEPRHYYHKYFTPINLSVLNIKLYDDSGYIYHNNNSNLSLEFQITMLNKSIQ